MEVTTLKKVGDWQFPEVKNLLGRRELGKSTFIGKWGLPQQLRDEFKEYELNSGSLYIHAFGQKYPARIVDTLENLNLDFSASYLQDVLSDLLEEEKDFLFANYKKRERKRLPEGEKVYIDLYKELYYLKGIERPRHKYVIKIYRQQPESNESTKEFISSFNENEIESIFNHDMSNEKFEEWLKKVNGDGKVILKDGIKKIRVFQKKIIRELKLIYNRRCQICGCTTVKDYGVDTTEAHHIEHFSKTFNNSPKNIIILCPNHHRLMHRLDFRYERDKQQFVFNKTILKIQMDEHLK